MFLTARVPARTGRHRTPLVRRGHLGRRSPPHELTGVTGRLAEAFQTTRAQAGRLPVGRRGGDASLSAGGVVRRAALAGWVGRALFAPAADLCLAGWLIRRSADVTGET